MKLRFQPCGRAVAEKAASVTNVAAYLKLCEQRKWKRFVRGRLDLAAPSDDSVAASNLAA